MATSGSVDFSMNSRDIVAAAMRKLGVLDARSTPTARETDLGLQALNLLLKSWTASEHLWIRTRAIITLVAGQIAYVIPNARRVESVRYRISNRDVPITMLSSSDYDDVPTKYATGIPISCYFDPQRTIRTLYIWQAPNAAIAAQYTLPYTYLRVIEDCDTLDNDPDIPQEWLETLVYNLAVRIAPDYGVGSTNKDFADVQNMAQSLLLALKAQDQDDTPIYFQPDYQGGGW